MEPNYKEGEIFLLNKIRYRFMDFKRFDVVVLNNKKSKYMIKRIIGLPGESIEYKEDVLYVDGVKVEENFSRNGETVDYDVVKMLNQRIPNDYYFVVGDNRVNSEDSRIFGFVSKQDIIGKVEFRIWPLFK